jgi:hypothetical protein
MKKLIIALYILFGSFYIQANENKVYYYNRDKKIYLDKIENSKLLYFKKDVACC